MRECSSSPRTPPSGRPAGPPRDGRGRTYANVAALIPALDEEAALPGVISGLRAHGVRRIVVADNGSSDRTARVAGEAGARVVLEPRRGYGAACLAGIRLLERDDPAPEVVVFLDGDQSDDLSALSRILDPLLEGRADLVVGVRTGGREGRSPLHARAGTALVLAGARLVHGARFRDLGPFRAVRWSTLAALAMDDRTWGWTLQMQLRAHRRGARILEVEVPHLPRGAGRSKVSGSLTVSLRAGARMGYTLLRERLISPGSLSE
jgi:glycosyltransferase involved in cell wall biosynthesis